ESRKELARERSVEQAGDSLGFGRRGAGQKITRIVADDRAATPGADGRELRRLVETGNGDFPRAERVGTDAEDRKPRLPAVNAARPSVEPIGVAQEVSPRFGSPIGE